MQWHLFSSGQMPRPLLHPLPSVALYITRIFILVLCFSLSLRSVDVYTVPGVRFTVPSLLISIGSFCGIFLGSFLLGCAMGLLTALVSSY